MEAKLQNRWILLAALFAVIVLGWVTVWLTKFSSDPLSVLPLDVPEIDARRVYQQHFLQEDDLIIAIHSTGVEDPFELAMELRSRLESTLPDLVGHIRDGFPWESDDGLAQMGALAGYAWVQADPKDVEALVRRLGDPSRVQEAIANAKETLATSFALEPEEAMLAIDPLQLGQVPGMPLFGGQASEALNFGDGDLRALVIDLPGNRNDVELMSAWQSQVTEVMDQWRVEEEFDEGVRFTITGYGPYICDLNRSMWRELVLSATITITAVLVLFLLVYRTAYPLAVLCAGLAITALSTILIGGQMFGELNAISIGFAAILIALVVDYSVIVYQERVQPSDESDTFRGAVVGPVVWAAGTTALVFFALNFSSMPGISQLGTLVSIGLVIGALVSLTFFHRLILRKQLRQPRNLPRLCGSPRTSLILTLFVILFVSVGLWRYQLPGLDTSAETMLPKDAEAIEEYKAITKTLKGDRAQPIAVLFRAEEFDGVREAMQDWSEKMSALSEVQDGTPLALWPGPEGKGNLDILAQGVLNRDAVISALSEEFDTTAVQFVENAYDHWAAAVKLGENLTPSPVDAQWMLDQTIQLDVLGKPTAKGLVFFPGEEWPDSLRQQLLDAADEDARVTLLGWEHLSPVMARLYAHDSRWVVLPSALILLVVLFVVFRSIRGVFLSVLTLTLSSAMLVTVMSVLGNTWNQFSLMAVPLLLGASLDYNIHVQLALRRSGGDLKALSQTLGKALFVCGCSTTVGFGSLCVSNHPGLASLGETCAIGIVCTLFVSLTMLPGWWCLMRK